jgi:hypothetical protein
MTSDIALAAHVHTGALNKPCRAIHEFYFPPSCRARNLNANKCTNKMESSSYRRYHWFQMALIVAGITTFAFAIPGCGTPGVERVDGTVERDYTIYVNSSASENKPIPGKPLFGDPISDTWRLDLRAPLEYRLRHSGLL